MMPKASSFPGGVRNPLFLVCAYHGAGRDGAISNGLLARLLRLPKFTGHRRIHRDFYANPRDLAYQIALVAQQLPGSQTQREPMLLVDRKHADTIAKLPGLSDQVIDLVDVEAGEIAQKARSAISESDGVFLVYSDAIGIGCEHIEALVRRIAQHEVWIINGRRRVFRLTSTIRRRLGLSRFLARSRLVEYNAALVLSAVGYVLAGWDYCLGRR